jgi:hypothetical protein
LLGEGVDGDGFAGAHVVHVEGRFTTTTPPPFPPSPSSSSSTTPCPSCSCSSSCVQGRRGYKTSPGMPSALDSRLHSYG